MSSSAQILRAKKTTMTTEERVKEFLEIIAPLGYITKVEKYDNSVYMNPGVDAEKGVNLWVRQDDYPIFTINGKAYYREVFFDFVWDDERYGIESMNSDMILDIVRAYMKKYPDALFNYGWSVHGSSPFLDKTDIDAVVFRPDWFGSTQSHLRAKSLDQCFSKWVLEE